MLRNARFLVESFLDQEGVITNMAGAGFFAGKVLSADDERRKAVFVLRNGRRRKRGHLGDADLSEPDSRREPDDDGWDKPT